jgi:hypothetical protein
MRNYKFTCKLKTIDRETRLGAIEIYGSIILNRVLEKTGREGELTRTAKAQYFQAVYLRNVSST